MSTIKLRPWSIMFAMLVIALCLPMMSVHAASHCPLSSTTQHRINDFNQTHNNMQFYLRIKNQVAHKDISKVSQFAHTYFQQNVDDSQGILLYMVKSPYQYQFVLGADFARDLHNQPLLNPSLNHELNRQHYNLFIQQFIQHLNSIFPATNALPHPKSKKSIDHPHYHRHKQHVNKASQSVDGPSNHHPTQSNSNNSNKPKKSLSPAARQSMMIFVFVLTLILGLLLLILAMWWHHHKKVWSEIKFLKRENARQKEKLAHPNQQHKKEDPPIITLQGRK